MFTKDSKSVVGIFGKSLSKQAVTKDDIRELGKSAMEHLNKSIVMKSRKDPRGAISSIHKSCWYLDAVIKALEIATGVKLEKSADQSNTVKQKVDSASDWINTANEKDIYGVLDGCVGALKTAISALTVAAESVTDDETVTKDLFSKVTERGIYKAWQHADGTWWDHGDNGQITQVQAPGASADLDKPTCPECGAVVDKPGLCENCKNTMSAASNEGKLQGNLRYKNTGEVSSLPQGEY